ncbi:uncharacterized protein [Rutidosis leptorrhynchoides]|uniref:uncharacterized protein n=1 Tax=Rutidosis leptorrhynchoides TaxID=125765 RepID=UPI003A98D32A
MELTYQLYDDDDVTHEKVRDYEDDQNGLNDKDGSAQIDDYDECVYIYCINIFSIMFTALGEVLPSRKRGPTSMTDVWNQKPGCRITVTINPLGQPICDNTSKLTHFLGTIARSCKHCPIDLPWTKVSKDQKQEIIKTIRSKFIIPKHADRWMLRSIGRKVKNWRARLKKKHWDSSKSFRKQVKSRPPELEKAIWKSLVTMWNNEAVQEKCAKNKANWAKKVMVQVTGKKSYARIREELKKNMDDLTKDLPEGTVDAPGPDDVFAQVVGNNKYGAADMYGLGVRQADLWGNIPSRNVVLIENVKLKSDNELMEDNTGAQGDTRVNVPPRPRLKVGDEVFLHNIVTYEKVAKAWLRSMDPTTEVGGIEIGEDWCSVEVQAIIKRGSLLVRPFDLFMRVGDAGGACVAWPSTYLSVVPLD